MPRTALRHVNRGADREGDAAPCHAKKRRANIEETSKFVFARRKPHRYDARRDRLDGRTNFVRASRCIFNCSPIARSRNDRLQNACYDQWTEDFLLKLMSFSVQGGAKRTLIGAPSAASEPFDGRHLKKTAYRAT
jgi:hypothetical protein